MPISNILFICFGVFSLFLSAQVSYTLYMIPFTMQTLALMVLSLSYNNKLALCTVCTYVLLGALGAPLFAKYSRGISVIFGKTEGYLIGFILAVWAVGIFREKFGESSFLHVLIYCTISHLIICLLGLTQLSYFIGLSSATKEGLIPFILPAIIKIFMASLLIEIIRPYSLKINRRFT